MNKRSAVVLAGGLAAALLVAAAAVSAGLSTGGVASATPRERQWPVVRTTHRTATAHKPSSSSPARVRTMVIGSSSSGSEGDDAFEGQDDRFEEQHDGFEREVEFDGGGSAVMNAGPRGGRDD